MSRAFVKETDADPADDLPDREISPHPNYVTAAGLALIETRLAAFQRDYAAAKAADDRAGLARAARELRYWTARRQSAQLVEPESDGTVRFGSRVTLLDGGQERRFRIVGEDEADPAQGSLSHTSPLARALSGKEEDDQVRLGARELTILRVD